MKNIPIHIFYLLLCCTCLASCRHDNIARLLQSAESLMWDNPDSVLHILEQIPSPRKLKGQKQADYALLLTQAKYRCNILAPSDSLINIAVNYYKDGEDADKKGAAYLYKGGVLNDLNEPEKAIRAYKQAEECIPQMKNTHLIARIYSDLGYLNQSELNYDIAKEYYKKSLSINKNAGYMSNIANDLMNLTSISMLFDCQNEQDSAEYYISELLDLIPRVDSAQQIKLYHNIAVQKMYKEDYAVANEYFLKLKEISGGKLSDKALAVWGKLYVKTGHADKADSLLNTALSTSDLTVKANIYSSLYEQAEANKQYKQAIGYLKKHIATIDSVRDELKNTEIREIQMKYDQSITLRQNAEIRMKWYLTLAIGALALIALAFFYAYSWKLYKKQKEKELFSQKQASARLQTRIEALQEVIEENKNLHNREREEALREITALQKEKNEKDIRVKQLEIMFRAKNITISSLDVEALQTFLRITQQQTYIPTMDRENLHRWIDITHQNFATRLINEFPALTGREKDICYLTVLDLSFDSVAQLLEVQSRSVERYISRVCEKLGFEKGNKETFINFVIAFAHNKAMHTTYCESSTK